MGRSISSATSATQISTKVIADVAVGDLACYFDTLGIAKWQNPPAMPFSQGLRLPYASLESSKTQRGSTVVPEAVVISNDQHSACTLTNGNIVVVYSGSATNLRFAIYKPDGTLVKSVTQVVAVSNVISDVTPLANGGFVIAANSNGASNAAWYVYDAAGNFVQNGSANGPCSDISVAGLSSGDFVVAYVESSAAKFVRCNSGGVQQGGITTTDAASVHNYIDVTALTGGGFVVVWGSSAPSVKFGRYDNSGVLQGSITTLASSGSPAWPCVAGLSSGGFAITWVDTTPNYPKYAIYSSAGVVVKAVTQLTSQTGASKLCIAGLVQGGFVIAYRQDNTLHYLDNSGNIDPATSSYSGAAGGSYLQEIASLVDGGLLVFATNGSNNPSFGFFSTYAVTIVGNVTSGATVGNIAAIETYGVLLLTGTYAESKSFSHTGGSLPGNKGTVFNGSIYMKGLS